MRKVGLLELAKQLGNVSQACKIMGYSRDSFYRFKELHDNGGELALQEISRKKPVLKNRVPQEIEDAIVALAVEQPAFGQVRIANELRKRGLTVSPAGVRCVWLRHDLETMNKRLRALEAKSAQEGLVLTEAQVVALEKAKTEKEAHGEFESEHPGYCGAQDTFYVGNLEGRRPRLPADLHRRLRRCSSSSLTSSCCSTGGGSNPSSCSFLRIISRISSAVMSPRRRSAFGSATASFMALIRGCRKLTISRAIRAAFCNALSTIRKSQNRPKSSSILALR